jgi:hypothetical protein
VSQAVMNIKSLLYFVVGGLYKTNPKQSDNVSANTAHTLRTVVGQHR